MFLKKISFLLLLLIGGYLFAQSQNSVTFVIKKMPVTSGPIYIAGTFNSWNPANTEYIFKRQENGTYTLTTDLKSGLHEFKITNGSWNNTECNTDGSAAQNHIITVQGNIDVPIEIGAWSSSFSKKQVASTASEQVTLLKKKFYIPKLKRYKQIWVYLPKGYKASKKKYPVLYMHDGQNIFDAKTAYSGEWGIDEFMDTTTLPQAIVVAINNDAIKRLNEYNPYNTTKYGKGEGKVYVNFIVHTIKPWIDHQYRTRPDKESTFIAGSSMGGLISLYALLYKPNIFGGAGVFSPAFWTTNDRIYADVKKLGSRVNSRIYFFAGKMENDSMVPDMLKAFNLMQKNSISKMITSVRDEGRHNEATWQHEFSFFYQWLFMNISPVDYQ